MSRTHHVRVTRVAAVLLLLALSLALVAVAGAAVMEGIVTTYAGTGAAADAAATATTATAAFRSPRGGALDSNGNVFIADTSNNCIRKVTPSGTVTLFAGSGSSSAGVTNGTGSAARFDGPRSIAIDSSDNLYVADSANNQIRKITPAGVVTLFAGSASGGLGTTNGTGSAARFKDPRGIAIDSDGNLFVADYGNNQIRKITSAAVVSLFAGSAAGTAGTTNATGSSARFDSPSGLKVDSDGNVWVADRQNNQIRKITSAAVVSLFAGSATGTSGLANGTGDTARFNSPRDVALDTNGDLYVADDGNNQIRRITSAAEVSLLAGSATGTSGSTNGVGTAARFNGPEGIWLAGPGTLLVGDTGNNRIRSIAVVEHDATSPVTTWEDEVAGWQTADVSVTLSATDTISGVASTLYRLNGGSDQPYSDPFTISAEGTTTLRYHSVDKRGNVEAENLRYVLIDKSAPVTTDDSPVGWSNSLSAVHLTATDECSGVAYTEFSLNGDPWAPYLGGVPIVADGTWTIDYRSVDNLGHVEDTRTATVMLDTVAPDLSVTGVENGASYKSSVTPQASTTDPSAEITATLNGDPYVPGDAITAEDVYVLVVSSVDQADNQTTETRIFTIDTTAPDLAISGVTDGEFYNTDVSPDASSTDGSAVLAATLNGAEFVLGTVVSDEGMYSLEVTATDPAGNETAASASFTIDKTAPSGTMTVNDGHNYTNQVGVNVDSDVAGATEMRLDAGTGWGEWFVYASQVATEVTAGDGEKTVYVEYRDQAGNVLELSDAITLDTLAPDVAVDGVSDSGFYGSAVTPTATSTDPDAIITATLNGGPFTLGTEINGDGAFTLVVRSTDPAGNYTEETLGFGLDVTAPDLTITGVEQGGSYNTTVTPDASSSDPSAEFVATLNGAEFELGSEVFDEGDYSLEVTATDQFSHVTAKAVQFTVDKTAPDVMIAGVTDGAVYTSAVTPTGSSSDPSAVLSATLNGDPFTLGTAVSAIGIYDLTVTAVDPAGNSAEASLSFEIQAPPVTVEPVGGSGRVDAAVQFSKDSWTSSKVVILARWDVHADVLAASGLAGSYRAPILLTSSSVLSPVARAEIRRLGATKVFIIGGTSAIKPAVSNSLTKMGISVERLGGKNRYETSLLVGKRIQKHDGANFSKYVIVANGSSWKTTLAVSALAYQLKAPVLFVTSTAYTASEKSFVTAARFKTLIVIGPKGAVSDGVKTALAKASKATAVRADGATRYEVAEQVTRLAYSYDHSRAKTIGLIHGQAWIYSTTAGPAMAHDGGLLAITNPYVLSTPTKRLFTDWAGSVKTIKLLGDGKTPTQTVADQAIAAMMK